MSASEEASRDFAAAFRTMVEWVHATGVPGGANAVVALIHDHLGPDRVGGSVVSRELAPLEQVAQVTQHMLENGDARGVHRQGQIRIS